MHYIARSMMSVMIQHANGYFCTELLMMPINIMVLLMGLLIKIYMKIIKLVMMECVEFALKNIKKFIISVMRSIMMEFA